MIPFENSWPYDIVMGDIYVQQCPYCHANNVLLPLKPKELVRIREGKKKLLVFPCCNTSMTVIDNDSDYLLSSRPVRN
ncbi:MULTISPECIES: hypothetical protein [Paenibacillus]|jgi:hypothetical protein|uniref:Uncharacterized protein n=1 Tax=Paenibacillus pabuli TaxID=1472 RepID=A0A855XK75_9BACL|nr:MULTISPECIES: hypothetical protein [Paenibacillus]MCP1186512.1 hypothetical protein [Paenibacillus sp. 1781tsa1]PWW32899.1 hypothetical protein DET56_12235 [Paenibacillus pabuli]PXV98782.1 hypothetical protein DEU73_12035 [Paenibacillus taichungensis]RAI96924.1 hypothetical protein DET54_106284 [Paenibacillus pabuli]UPK43101.1 hypothetical protein KET34_28900 [Paenibacillus pabuli]